MKILVKVKLRPNRLTTRLMLGNKPCAFPCILSITLCSYTVVNYILSM